MSLLGSSHLAQLALSLQPLVCGRDDLSRAAFLSTTPKTESFQGGFTRVPQTFQVKEGQQERPRKGAYLGI